MKNSFQDGVDTLYDTCVSCGSTPTDKTPTAISEAIKNIAGSSKTIVSLGSAVGKRTILDVKAKIPEDYAKLTIDNFFGVITHLQVHGRTWEHGASYPQPWEEYAETSMVKEYDTSTGSLTITGLYCNKDHHTEGWTGSIDGTMTVDMYAVY